MLLFKRLIIFFNPVFVPRDTNKFQGEGQVGRPCPDSGRHSEQPKLVVFIRDL